MPALGGAQAPVPECSACSAARPSWQVGQRLVLQRRRYALEVRLMWLAIRPPDRYPAFFDGIPDIFLQRSLQIVGIVRASDHFVQIVQRRVYQRRLITTARYNIRIAMIRENPVDVPLFQVPHVLILADDMLRLSDEGNPFLERLPGEQDAIPRQMH